MTPARGSASAIFQGLDQHNLTLPLPTRKLRDPRSSPHVAARLINLQPSERSAPFRVDALLPAFGDTRRDLLSFTR